MNTKKILAAISTALLIVILAFTMAGCDKSGNVKKAFENEGYTVETVNTDNNVVKGVLTIAGLSDEQIKKINEYELILCVKGVNMCAVIKFPSSSDIKDFLTVEDKDGNKDSSAYDKAKEDGSINGNCLYIGTSTCKAIFEKA